MSRVFRLDGVLQNFQPNWLYIFWILYFMTTLWAAEGWIRRKITLKYKHFRFYFPRYVFKAHHIKVLHNLHGLEQNKSCRIEDE